jgi:hypothetical protein
LASARSSSRVFAERLQHPEARLVVELLRFEDEALLDERRELVGIGPADRLRRRQRPATREDRQTREEPSLRLGQQLVAPVDRRPEAPLTPRRVSRPFTGNLEAPRQTTEHLLDREVANAGRGELDRKRKAVQRVTELTHRRGGIELPVHRPRPGDEELHGLLVGERRHAELVLAVQAEGLPAGDQDAEAGSCREQRPEDRGRGLHLLEVVDQQQGRALAKVLGELALRPEHGRDLGGNELRVAERRDADERHAVREGGCELVGGLECNPRLPDPSRPGQRDEASAPSDELRELVDLAPPSHQGRRRCRELPTSAELGRLDGEGRVLAQDGSLEQLQLRTGLQAELVEQRTPRVPIGVQGLGLAAASV